MLTNLRRSLRRYAWHQKLYARKVRWMDWKDNVLGESLREADTPYGFKLLVRNHPANREMLTGTFEPEEVAVFNHHLSQADVFVDVGANIGFYTCLALRQSKHVVAIEPQPRNLRCLYQNLLSNHWEKLAEVYPLGLGTDPGVQVLYGASGPSASLIPRWAQYSDTFRQTIAVSTLDILLGDRFAGKKVFIKIDVEGYEYNVLKGSLRTLQQGLRPSWLIEICLSEYHPSGMNPDYKAAFELFWSNGYEARTADSRSKLVSPGEVDRWCARKQSDSGTINYLFTPATGTARSQSANKDA